jgi:glutamate-1-semialdehyde 2,1-aminomutase
LTRSRARETVGAMSTIPTSSTSSVGTTRDGERVAAARQAFAERNPQSRMAHERARAVMSGGHTRTTLAHPPFPLTFARGAAATLTDVDGHEYIDLLGDYTAALLGHSDRRVLDAVQAALGELHCAGGMHRHEVGLATLMCERFGLERVRFTNSGTEANLMAITTAMAFTGRKKLMVFHGGYHGGVLYFATGPAASNAPYEFVVAPYNDLPGTLQLIDRHGRELAAVLVEPMLGSGGCVPARAEFLAGVFAAARDAGAVCIADEVMTSRHGARGLLALRGLRADITTYGKYLGGGFSFGAFGGRAELLDQFDSARPGSIRHAGTFNNNVATMAAGEVVLGEAYTADIAVAHTARGERFRAQVADVLGRHALPISVTGFGSMLALHAVANAPADAHGVAARDPHLQELVFLGLYRRGIYLAPRGMMSLSLPLRDDQLATALDALDDCLRELAAR